jgi:hypothetical protein
MVFLAGFRQYHMQSHQFPAGANYDCPDISLSSPTYHSRNTMTETPQKTLLAEAMGDYDRESGEDAVHNAHIKRVYKSVFQIARRKQPEG